MQKKQVNTRGKGRIYAYSTISKLSLYRIILDIMEKKSQVSMEPNGKEEANKYKWTKVKLIKSRGQVDRQ